MKLYSLALIGLLALVPASAQEVKAPALKEYNIGVCGVKEFFALHVEITDKALIVTRVSMGPNRNDALLKPLVYVADKKDADGSQHYILKDDTDSFDVVLKVTGSDITGVLFVNGEKAGKLYGFVASGDDLAKQALIFFSECQQMREGAPQEN